MNGWLLVCWEDRGDGCVLPLRSLSPLENGESRDQMPPQPELEVGCMKRNRKLIHNDRIIVLQESSGQHGYGCQRSTSGSGVRQEIIVQK